MKVELVQRYVLETVVYPSDPSASGSYQISDELYSRWALFRREVEFFRQLFARAERAKAATENVVDINSLSK